MIEAAENVLRDLGFYDVRVRHHELRLWSHLQNPKPTSGRDLQDSSLRAPLARIEVGSTEMRKFLEGDLPGRVAEALKGIGYAHVTLDLRGYRRGSLNEPAREGAAGQKQVAG